MALNIIGAGFGRSAILSAYTALNQPGFPCYQMFEVLENPQNKTPLGFWRELFEANPDARVVLTVHPRGAEAVSRLGYAVTGSLPDAD